MKTIKNLSYIALLSCGIILSSCEPKALEPDQVFVQEDQLAAELEKENPVHGYKIYSLDEFLDAFMTEKGDFGNDTTPYRTRAYDPEHGLYLYSIDTIKTDTLGIYIRGRITTDDYAGNFYKSMVIQQIVDGKQQNLRISVDLGSGAGMYQIGQEILIRCNGLAVGRYANQPQLCVPSYNNNIYAMSASQKVGWCPGRIESSVFRRNTRMIGAPDVSKLVYDTLTLAQLYTEIVRKPNYNNIATEIHKIRKQDGRLVVIKGVHFTGQYDNNGSLAYCDTQHPDSSSNANVFAPTTTNIGYPQSRLVSDGTNSIMCSCSEYSKFAFFYLPGADKEGVTHCPDYSGTLTGILGWYEDKAENLSFDGKKMLDGYEWSVTPRGIPAENIACSPVVYDIKMAKADGTPWIPMEYDPNDK